MRHLPQTAFETRSCDSYDAHYETGSALSYWLRSGRGKFEGIGNRRYALVQRLVVTLPSAIIVAFYLSALLPLPVVKNRRSLKIKNRR